MVLKLFFQMLGVECQEKTSNELYGLGRDFCSIGLPGICQIFYSILSFLFSPASEASRVANLTERKNPHTPVYGVKEFVCLSVQNRMCCYLGSVFRLKSNS